MKLKTENGNFDWKSLNWKELYIINIIIIICIWHLAFKMFFSIFHFKFDIQYLKFYLSHFYILLPVCILHLDFWAVCKWEGAVQRLEVGSETARVQRHHIDSRVSWPPKSTVSLVKYESHGSIHLCKQENIQQLHCGNWTEFSCIFNVITSVIAFKPNTYTTRHVRAGIWSKIGD